MTLRVSPLGGLLDSAQECLLVIGIQLATVRVSPLGSLYDSAQECHLSIGIQLATARVTSTLVGGENLQDTAVVNLERDLNLGNTAWSRRNAGEFEFPEKVVVLGEGVFTLEYLDQNGELVVGGGGEDLALAGGNDGVAGDKLGHDTADGLDTEGEGVDIDKDDITQALVASEDTALNGGTIGSSLVRVDALGRLLPEVFLEELLDLGDAGGTTDEDDLRDILVGFVRLIAEGTYLIDILLLEIGVLENLVNELHGLPEQVYVQLLELGPSQRLVEVVAVLERFDFDPGRLPRG